MSSTSPIGVLLLAYGGPNSLGDIPGYLADIRSGRPTPGTVLKEISHNYELIGGKSPLLDFTRQQAAAVLQALEQHPPPVTVSGQTPSRSQQTARRRKSYSGLSAATA